MSALGQKRTLSTLLDHLVGASDQRRRHCKTECLCSAEVDSKVELCRKFNRKIARLLAFQYPSDIDAGTAISVRGTSTITDQSSGGGGAAKRKARRNCVECGKPNQLVAVGAKKCTSSHKSLKCNDFLSYRAG